MDCDELSLGAYHNAAAAESEEEERFYKQTYSWEKLKEIEQRRRAILKRTELPFWRILSYWDGTCLNALSADWMLWITVAIYCLVRVLARFQDKIPVVVRVLGDTDIDVIGGFLSFFLVLFVNQSNARFNDMYKHSTQCAGKILEVASLVNAAFPNPEARRMVRYMVRITSVLPFMLLRMWRLFLHFESCCSAFHHRMPPMHLATWD